MFYSRKSLVKHIYFFAEKMSQKFVCSNIIATFAAELIYQPLNYERI